jgi:hypothetical protein
VLLKPSEGSFKTKFCSGVVAHTCNPSYLGGRDRMVVQIGPGIKQKPISKITKAKRTGGVAQVVEHLPSKHRALALPCSASN